MDKRTIKRMAIMLVALVAFFALFFGAKILGYKAFMAQMAKNAPPPPTVTTTHVALASWQPELQAVGTLRAPRGVDVSTEVAGLVRSVHFTNGQEVKAGMPLLDLNADSDVASLHALQATAALSATTLKRDRQQFEAQAISRAQLDNDEADLKNRQAQVAQQQAIVDKKQIRAPFAGRLGIATVAPGQYVNPGDKIVTLQSIDPIFVDFNVPQQQLGQISLGQKIEVTSDGLTGMTFGGQVVAINPRVDASTRNVQIEAVVQNNGKKLLPGMFANVRVLAGAMQQYLTLPQTAVTYNPYGATVFVVKTDNAKDSKTSGKTIGQQVFVTAGPTRGDQVAIVKGLTAGDEVVTSGQLKLKTGSPLQVNNTVVPANDPNPQPQEQ